MPSLKEKGRVRVRVSSQVVQRLLIRAGGVIVRPQVRLVQVLLVLIILGNGQGLAAHIKVTS